MSTQTQKNNSLAKKNSGKLQLHQLGVDWVTQQLKKPGLFFVKAPKNAAYDLSVKTGTYNSLRVAVRVAQPHTSHQKVRVGGRRYAYEYKALAFNFHQHGKMPNRHQRRYADIVICCAVDESGKVQGAYIIPWYRVSGKTLLVQAKNCSYRGRYAGFWNRWDILTTWLAHAEAKAWLKAKLNLSGCAVRELDPREDKADFFVTNRAGRQYRLAVRISVRPTTISRPVSCGKHQYLSWTFRLEAGSTPRRVDFYVCLARPETRTLNEGAIFVFPGNTPVNTIRMGCRDGMPTTKKHQIWRNRIDLITG